MEGITMGSTEFLIMLIVVLLVFGISWIGRKGRKRDPPQPKHSQATRQAASSSPPGSPATRLRLVGPFADVERQVEVLRRQVTDGLLTEGECKTRMRDLMVEDAGGNWWMVGYETGEWYRHDGTDWMRANPPLARADERSTGSTR